MGKIKKLSDMAKIELGFKPRSDEERARFIDIDTDTSSLDSKSESSSSDGDYYLDYRSVGCKDRANTSKATNTPQKTTQKTLQNEPTQQTPPSQQMSIQFDNSNETISFAGPFTDEFTASTQEPKNKQCKTKEENKGFLKRIKERVKIPKCFWLFGCAFCV